MSMSATAEEAEELSPECDTVVNVSSKVMIIFSNNELSFTN